MTPLLYAALLKCKKGQPFSYYPVEGNYRVYDADQALGKLWENPRRIALLDWLKEQQP